MFFLIGMLVVCMLATAIFESGWLEQELMMRRLIRESREYARQREKHRNVYSVAGYYPPQPKKHWFERRG